MASALISAGAVIGLSISTCLVGCRWTGSSEEKSPFDCTAAERKAVVASAENLRDLVNRQACDLVYNQTERIERLREEWVRGCKDLQMQLGVWTRLTQLTAYCNAPRRDSPRLRVDGQAEFASGDGHLESYRFRSYWDVNNNSGVLIDMRLEGRSKQIAIPADSTPSRKLLGYSSKDILLDSGAPR